MVRELNVDICVIGAGSGGLTVAAGAAQMGASTVLIERGKMGGDCLNYGCVPSKSLIAAAAAAAAVRRASAFGVDAGAPRVDFARVHAHVHDVIARIAPNDSEARFEGLGATVIRAPARFTGPREVAAGDVCVRARRFVIATGSAPAVPPIPGLEVTPYFTNETIFDNNAPVDHLVVIGGGPIGVELAQAHRRLGARVTVAEMATILPRDDPELVDVVRHRLVAEGVDLREGVTVEGVEKRRNGIVVRVRRGEHAERIDGSHLLIAAGRRPNVEGLDLEAAGVAFSAKGIVVDRRLRTTNRRIFAVGDVVGTFPFTHTASYHAGIVIRNALFRIPARISDTAIPWVTYTHPELAHVGLGEAAARARGGRFNVLRWPYHENDRAQAERVAEGLVKVIAGPRGRILGASIVGAAAGELIQPWVLAIGRGLRLADMARMVAPYPTLGEVNKRAAGSYFMPKLLSPRTRRLVRFLARFG